jgi:hypothetical protein
VIARSQQAEDSHRGSGARSICRRVCAAFERGDALFQRTARWIVGARVGKAAGVFAVDVTLERRAHLDGRGDGASGWLDIATGVDRQGFKLHQGFLL